MAHYIVQVSPTYICLMSGRQPKAKVATSQPAYSRITYIPYIPTIYCIFTSVWLDWTCSWKVVRPLHYECCRPDCQPDQGPQLSSAFRLSQLMRFENQGRQFNFLFLYTHQIRIIFRIISRLLKRLYKNLSLSLSIYHNKGPGLQALVFETRPP